MNMIVGITYDDVSNLIASGNDEEDTHMLCVARNGDVTLETVPEHTTPVRWWMQHEDHFLFRLESFQQGNGYVGSDAAKDRDWIRRLYNALLKNWEEKTEGYVDEF